jgi:hypothetical protein
MGSCNFGRIVRAAFASQTIGSVNYPFAMLFHIELAEAIHSPR